MDGVAAAARAVAGGVLLVAGLAKLVSHRQVVAALTSRGVRGRAPEVVSIALPLAECSLGAAVLTVGGPWPVWLAVAAYSAFLGMTPADLLRGVRTPCPCFGAIDTRPVSGLTFVRNAWFLAVALVGTAAPGIDQASWPALALGGVVSLVLVVRS